MSGPRTAVCGGTLAADYGVFAADILIEEARLLSRRLGNTEQGEHAA